jgi:hypothetical protein
MMRLEHALAGLSPQASDLFYDFSGVWTNELGSTMTLDQSNTQIGGTYVSAVGDDTGTAALQAATGTLLGWASGYVISLTVMWQGYQSITAWVGQLVQPAEGTYIDTMWQLSSAIADPTNPTELWNSLNAGHDTFWQTGPRPAVNR